MSGHSKWSTIKRKKEKTDSARAKIFTKIGRELAVAVKEGGPIPENNSKLRDCIAKAKANNVPNDNIERIIKKAAGDGSSTSYEAITYEGYGPSGVAVMVESLTDNRNRTAAEVRHYFDKFGGNLGTPGCVSFMFEKKGVLVLDSANLDENKAFEDTLEAGADDFIVEPGVFIVYTNPDKLFAVCDALKEKNYQLISSEVEQIPASNVNIDSQEGIDNMQKLLDLLIDNDDIQNVWHNWNIPEV